MKNLLKWSKVYEKFKSLRYKSNKFQPPTVPKKEKTYFEVLDRKNPGHYLLMDSDGNIVAGDDYLQSIVHQGSNEVVKKMFKVSRELEKEEDKTTQREIEDGPHTEIALSPEEISRSTKNMMAVHLQPKIAHDLGHNPQAHQPQW